LQVMSDGVVRHRRELQPLVADLMELSQEQRDEAISSGEKKFENRIGWGLSFLTNVGALERPRRANYMITDAGRELISKFPAGATEREIRKLGHDATSLVGSYEKSERVSATTFEQSKILECLSPIEQLENAIERLRQQL